MTLDSFDVNTDDPKKIKPLGAKVLVKPVDPLKITPGGIIIPDMALRNRQEGIVVCLGTGLRTSKGTRIPASVALNDRVVFGSPAGIELMVNKERYLLLTENAILGTIAPNNVDIIPTLDRLLLEIIDDPYSGRLVIPLEIRRAMLSTVKCKVLAAGKGHYTSEGQWMPQNVEVGQTIMVTRGHITKFNIGSKTYEVTTRLYVLLILGD